MDLWRYCTAEKWQEFLVSLDLLGGVPADRAAYLRCLYALSNHPEAHYRTLSVPKRGGGRRTLREPDALLKKVQKNILRHILAGAPVSEYACAYRKGTGVRQNAAIHLGQPMILKLDIHDFFRQHHISHGDVERVSRHPVSACGGHDAHQSLLFPGCPSPGGAHVGCDLQPGDGALRPPHGSVV